MGREKAADFKHRKAKVGRKLAPVAETRIAVKFGSLDVFRAFGWPGNVRQLENVCRRVTIMAPSQTIELADLPKELTAEAPLEVSHSGDWEVALRRWADNHANTSQVPILEEAVPRFERLMINVALAKTQGRRHDAARLLGWGRNTLTRKIKELGMEP